MRKKGQLLAALQTVLGVWILVVAVLFGPLSYWFSNVDNTGVIATVGDPERSSGTAPLGVRSLPLKYDDHVLARYFPGETPFDEQLGAQALYELLQRTGLTTSWLGLARASIAQPVDELGGNQPQSTRPYPYWYNLIDPLLRSSLNPEAVRRDPKSVVELSTLLTALAASKSNQYEKFSLLAQALLRRAAEVNGTCDIRLSSAFVHSLGEASDDDGIRDLYRRAEEVCPGDPTPAFELGVYQVARSYVEAPLVLYRPSPPRAELQERALATFQALQSAHPDSPAGYGGEAYAYAIFAKQAEAARVQAFSVRMWKQRSLELYDRAVSLSNDRSLQQGRARALAAVARNVEAAELYRDLHAADPTDPLLQVELLANLRALGDYAAAADADSAMPDPVLPSGFRLRLRTHSDWSPVSTVPGPGPYRQILLRDGAGAGVGGSVLLDYEFLPDYRPFSIVSVGANWNRAAAHALDLILAGRAREAAAYLTSDGYRNFKGGIDATLSKSTEPPEASDFLLALAAAEAGDINRRDEILGRSYQSEGAAAPITVFYEQRQNLWRSVGNLGKAHAVIQEWLKEMPDDPYAIDRLGEVRYLQGAHGRAAKSFQKAARLFPSAGSMTIDDQSYGPEEMAAWALVKRGLAQEVSGAHEAAKRTYQDAQEQYATQSPGNHWEDKAAFYAYSQEGTLCLRQEDFECADEKLAKAVSIGRSKITHVVLDAARNLEEPAARTFMRGAQENNWALAKARLGDGQEAVEIARAALAHDPASPVFLDTLAYALAITGDQARALEAYQSSLATDPTNYVVRNNFAVLTAQWGLPDEAEAILRETVALHPRYGMGWFNLGVLLAKEPTKLFKSQGTLGRAALLDGRFREQDPELQLDHDLFDVGLDVSKAVPAEWSFAQSGSKVPMHITGLLLFVVAGRIAWLLGLDKLTGGLTEWLVHDGERSDFWRFTVGRKAPGWIAVLTTALALAIATVLAGRLLIEAAVTFVAVIGVLLLMLGVRALAIPDVRHMTWGPAVAATAVLIPLGAPIAPPPCLDPAATASGTRFRWLGPTVLAGAAFAFIVAATAFGTPISRLLAVAMLALLGTSLLPVPPMDGAYLAQGKKRLNLIVTVLIGCATLVFALNWL